MSTVVLEPVEVLVALATHLASVRLLLLHADSAGVWYRGKRVDDGESAVLVLLQLLVLVAVLLLRQYNGVIRKGCVRLLVCGT